MTRKRGFKAFKTHAKKIEKYIASCSSCMYMEDECINPNVTSFDVVKTDTSIYCSYWKSYISSGRKNDEI